MLTTLDEIVVLGAGVAGLTTAVTLQKSFPANKITVVGKFVPGTTSATEYTSPWAGANWISLEPTANTFAEYDRVTYIKLLQIAAESPESGVQRLPLRILSDTDSLVKQKPWFEELVGGTTHVPSNELPPGAKAGFDMNSFMINTSVYLAWLQDQLLRANVKFARRAYGHIDTLVNDFPNAKAFFNCTGLGARHLGGVEDAAVYPTKGQTLFVGEPKQPLKRMYVFINSKWENHEFLHVFPRPLGGGVVLGGIQIENDWTPEPDHGLTERIVQRACELCPELGKPEDVQVISENVGLRPTRVGGSRVELEKRGSKLLVHNYGAGAAGFQSSWGMADYAVGLLQKEVAAPLDL